MAIRTVAQAAADIRLSDAKANADFDRIRRDLIAKATRLEADLAVSIPVTVDQSALRTVASGLSNLQRNIAPVVLPVTVDTDQALADLAAFSQLDVVVTALAVLDADQALAEIVALSDLSPEVSVVIDADSNPAEQEMAGLASAAPRVVLGVDLDDDEAQRQLTGLSNAGFTIPVQVETQRAVAEVSQLADGPFTVKFVADVDDVQQKVTAVGDLAQPVTVSVLADVTAVPPAVEAIELPPIEVPVTATGFTAPGIGTSSGLARFRAEMAALESDGVLVRVGLDSDEAQANLRSLTAQDVPPVVVPVVADTDEALGDIAGVSGVDVQPVVVPVNPDLDQARAEVQHFGSSIGEQVTPGAISGGAAAGRAFGQSLLSTANRILSIGALTLGGFLASSLVQGFQRFTTIEDSTASLTVALQSATEAGEVLANVLNVVRGTPFRLDDFARAATNMISFGIAADKVPGYLTAIGEAAATRGSQANQFAQSLASIFGQIQAVGRINGEDIWQFGNVGVDALRILGNTVGVTTAEIRKMISEGAIPAGFALDALANGILNGTDGINGATVAFAGTMEKLGDTLSGSIENFGAATSRLGVAVIDPLSDTLTAGFQSFTKVIDDFTARTKVAFTAVAESDFIEAFNDFFENAPSLIEPTVNALEDLGPAIAPIGVAFGALGLGALGAALGPLGGLIPGVTGISGALTVAAGAVAILTPEIRNALIPALKDLGEIGLDIGGTIVRGLGAGIEAVTPTVVRAIGVVRTLAPQIRETFEVALGSLASVGTEILPILDNLVTFAEEALPVALRATAQGVVLVTQAAAAAAPIVDRIVDVGRDLVPVAETFLDIAQVVGGVLIPVIGTLGDMIGALPVEVLETMLGVFLGFKAATFVQGIVGSLEGGFRRLGETTGRTIKSIREVSTTAVAAGATVSGAFAGMALASEDASTRMVGAVGAIGTILTGFALGGAPGGLFATIGVGIGIITQGFIDSKREAEELERAVGQLADRIRSEFNDELITPEGLINTNAFEDIVLQGIGTDALKILENELGLGFEEIQAAASIQAQQVQEAIDAGLDPDDVTFFEQFVDETIGQLARLRAEADGFQFSEILNERIRGFDFSEIDLNESEFKKITKDLADEFGLDVDNVRAQFKATEEAAADLGDEYKGTMLLIGESTESVLVQQEFMKDAITATGDAAEESGDAQVSAADEAARALAQWKRAINDDMISMEELREQAKLLGDEAVESADRATAAFDRFGDVLDSIKGRLNLRVQSQNLDQDFRDLGESLSRIVNTDDLKKVEGVGDDIGAVEKRIAELKGRLAEETAQGDVLRVDLLRRIANAERIGAVNAAAALRTEFEETFFGARDIQADINEQVGKLSDLRGQLAEVAAVPETLLQRLTRQAREANLSFFEFLLAAPTPEAQSFFQDGIADTVDAALANAADVAEAQGPIAGAIAAESFLAPFRASLISGGIDAATVDSIIAEIWPEDLITLSSEQAALAAAEAFAAEVERLNAAEPGTIDLNAEIVNLEEQQAEIDAFLDTHPDVNLPLGLDLVTLEEDLAALRERLAQENATARAAAEEEARRVEQLERFGGPAAVRRAFPTPKELAEEAVDTIESEIEALNNSDRSIIELTPKIEDIDAELNELQALLDDPNNHIRLSAEFDPEALRVSFEEAITNATQRFTRSGAGGLMTVPGFGSFMRQLEGENAEGGIVGYRDTPHQAQIAHGYRLWAEPETGGEAYIPLSQGKRVSALGVFNRVADIFELDVRPRKDVETFSDIRPPEVSIAPNVQIPELARMFDALEARSADMATTVRNAVVDAMHGIRRPVTQEDLERNVIVERIEQLTIGPGESARKRASQFIREMRLRAARL